MKLGIATAVLASTFSQIAGSDGQRSRNGQQQPQQLMQRRQTTLQTLQRLRRGNVASSTSSSSSDGNEVNKKMGNVPASSHPSPTNRLSWKMSGGQPSGLLKNAKKLALGKRPDDDYVECDPTVPQRLDDGGVETRMDEATTGDVGILSCGVGRYCKESVDSSIGGVCTSISPLDGTPQRRMADKHTNLLGGNRAFKFVGNASSPSLMDTITYACDVTDYCDCSKFDFEDFEGMIECTNLDNYCSTSANYCKEDVELCFSVTSSLSVTGPSDYTYTECVHYTTPYQQKVCVSYDTAAPEACQLDFNNETCQSCETQLRIYEDTYNHNGTTQTYSYNKRCFEFDCTGNAAGADGHRGNSCDRDIATIGYNVAFGDDCARCLTCGMGYKMTNGSAVHTFPVIGEYRCDGLELATALGFVDLETCPEIQKAAFGPCGCEPIFFDPDVVGQNGVPTASPSVIVSTGSSAALSSVPSESPSTVASVGPSAALTVAPSTVVANDGVPCYICGDKNATFANSDGWVILPIGASTCTDLAKLALGNMFSADYCTEQVQPLADTFCDCGLPVTSRLDTPEPIGSSSPSTTIVASSTAAPTTSPSISLKSSQPSIDPEVEQLPPETSFVCNACGTESTVADATLMVPLSNGATTCGALSEAGLAGVFTEEYCKDTIIPLIKMHCGCNVASTTDNKPNDSGGKDLNIPANDSDGQGNLTSNIPAGVEPRKDDAGRFQVPSAVPSEVPSAAPSPVARPLVNEILSSRVEELQEQPPTEDGFSQSYLNSGTAESLWSNAPTVLGWTSAVTITASMMFLVSMSVCL